MSHEPMLDDPNVRKLEELFSEHWELKKAFNNEATVYAWFKQYQYGRCTLEEAFIGIIVHLTKEKKAYFDQAAKLMETSTAPKKFYVNMSDKEIEKLKEQGQVQLKKPVYEDIDDEL